MRRQSTAARHDARQSKCADVVVRKRKFDGTIKSLWEGAMLASPEADWLLVLHDPRIHRKCDGDDWSTGKYGDDPCFLHCLCTSEPLTVLITYGDDGSFAEATCDAALPAVLSTGFIEYTDLDLDLIVEWDFSTYLRDQDTFHIHREIMQYPDDVVRQAWDGIKLARRLVATREFPFDADRLSLQKC